jgi:hypothetical protein
MGGFYQFLAKTTQITIAQVVRRNVHNVARWLPATTGLQGQQQYQDQAFVQFHWLIRQDWIVVKNIIKIIEPQTSIGSNKALFHGDHVYRAASHPGLSAR